MSAYERTRSALKTSPRRWVVTGVAGFIGSNLLQSLLDLDQTVLGVDNFSTGSKRNLEQVRSAVALEQWQRFRLVEGNICDLAACHTACQGADIVLHQAGINSAPRSLDDPVGCHASNVTGFLNMLLAARDASVRRFAYASSSTVYGDHPALPKIEADIGQPLSPYGASKQMAEMYAEVFAKVYGFESIGLRYFNVFGPRQDLKSDYAAVIPKWIASMIRHEPVCIYGDGQTSRDFCYVENIVQANLLAATTMNTAALNQVYNVGVGRRTTLIELCELLYKQLSQRDPSLPKLKPVYRDFRAGDVRHSLADISKAAQLLDFRPTHNIDAGLEATMDWYRRNVV